jgi:1-deoxy-D-xylulose-5-phosphate synthase
MAKRIEDFNFPEDLKGMGVHELELLAVAIREFLLDNVSKTGGHLASNLGIVEITIGLHKVFDSPKDKILWDVGHQSYVHKILTGRSRDFKTLRQTGGLSGFPKKRESRHDIYETGHASTSVSAGLGLAKARDIQGDDYNVIAVTGDGSLTGGPSLEGLNNAGNTKTKLIIIFNDNGMSISQNTGGLADHFAKLRTSPFYLNVKAQIKNRLEKNSGIGAKFSKTLSKTKDSLKYTMMSGGIFFEELGLTYLGPFDGHDIGEVINVLEQAKNAQKPVLIHFITKKGKGYIPAERNPDLFHGIGAFDPATGKVLSPPAPAYSDVFGESLISLAKDDPKIVAITAAMCSGTGLDLFRLRYPKRFFDVGIAEAHAVIFAAGLAMGGLKPVVAIYSSFLQRSYDEILEDVCLQDLPVVFAIDRAGIVGSDGETHHGIFDISYLMHMPGLMVLAPADADQLREMIKYALNCGGPVAIRYPRGKACEKKLVKDRFGGRNHRIKTGSDADIFAVGTMLEKAIAASEILESKGYKVGVVNIGVVKPFDTSVMPDDPKPIFTLEDNVTSGGFGEHLRGLFPDLKIINMGWPDKFIEHGSVDDLYAKYGLDEEGIERRILDELEGEA